MSCGEPPSVQGAYNRGVADGAVAASVAKDSPTTAPNIPSAAIAKIAAEMEGTVASHEKIGADMRRCDVAKWARQLRALV